MPIQRYMGTLLLLTSALFTAPAPEAPDTSALIREGTKLHDAGKYKEAIEKYDLALKADPKSCVALYEKIFSLYASGDLDATAKVGEAAVKDPCPGNRDMRMMLANVYDDRGENARAIELLKVLAKEAPSNAQMHFNLAISYHRGGFPGEAEQSLQAAIRADPLHVSSHYALGKLLFGSKQKAKGVLCFYMALLIDPNGRRSQEIYRTIDKYYGDLAQQKDGNKIVVTVDPSGKVEDAGFSDLSLGMSAALAQSKKLKKDAAFEEITFSYLQILSELREKEKGFYWSQYVDFYTALRAARHGTAFIKMLQVTASSDARTWLEANREKALMLTEWVKGRLAKQAK